MITEADLKEAIAECQGQKYPNANTCIKLAAFLTIQKAMYGSDEQPTYSYASAQMTSPTIDFIGDSDFAKTVDGKRQDFVLPILDELMAVLKATQPRLYEGVLHELQN